MSQQGGDAFARLVRLLESVATLSPVNDDRAEITAIRVYHAGLAAAARLVRRWPAVSYWLAAEIEDCAHLAAVAFDRRAAAITSDLT